MAELLKGAPVAAALNRETAAACAALKENGVIPTLAILRIGERPDDLAYERGIVKVCEKTGLTLRTVVLPENVGQSQLIGEIETLNTDAGVHGILMFSPLPKHLDEKAARAALSAEKDVDGVTEASLGGVFTGSGTGFAPCTPQAVMEILKFYGIDCAGKTAAVVGRSLVVGKPLSMLLIAANATVTVCHTKTPDLPGALRRADILIAAVGRAGAVGADCFAPGQVVIDVGINVGPDGRLCGDADFAAALDAVSAITPVPGGVGSVTTAVLASHVSEAAIRSCG